MHPGTEKRPDRPGGVALSNAKSDHIHAEEWLGWTNGHLDVCIAFVIYSSCNRGLAVT